MKGGFQNVTWKGIKHVVERDRLGKWALWLREFCHSREVIMS